MLLNSIRKMKGLILVFCQLILLFPASNAENIVVSQDASYGIFISSYSIKISPYMKTAIDKLIPDFKVWDIKAFSLSLKLDEYGFTKKQSPQAVFGDFNGDGDPDAVFWGHDKKNALLIGVLSHEKEAGSWEYKAQIIVKGPFASLMDKRCGDYKDKGIGEYLTLVPKGLVKHDCGPGPISLEGDAFILDKFCTTKDDRFGYRFYYYENGKFLSYPLICE